MILSKIDEGILIEIDSVEYFKLGKTTLCAALQSIYLDESSFDQNSLSSSSVLNLGIGFSFLFLNLDAAYYNVETGEYPGQTPENRVMIGLSMDLSVDANFNFYSKDGKKRKLKQRR